MDYFENNWTLLHLLWIIPVFGLLVYYASSKRKKVLAKIFGVNAYDHQYSTLSKGRRYLRTWLLLAAIVFLIIAVARPRWGWRILPYSGRGRDLMIVLDVSKSMNSEDVKPSRLKHAKLFLRDLIKACDGDRFGLVAFAGSAFLDCPLTVDKTSLFQTLDETTTDSIPVGGTNIENALNTAITAFQAAEGGYRAIILITDGDELYGNSTKALETLKKYKIPLFVVGIGDPTGDGLIKMTDANGKTILMRDSKGELIKSRLNEPQLKKLASKTKGIYVRSTETNPEISPIMKRIRKLVPKEFEKGNNKRPIERFHYPLFAAVLLLLIRLGIGERRKINGNGSGGVLALILMFFIIGATPLHSQQQPPVDQGNSTPENIAPEPLELGEAISDASDAKDTRKAEQTAIDLYNSGLKFQLKKNKEEAAEKYKKAINLSDKFPEVRGKSFQNMGVISHNQARSVMTQDPDKALKILDKTEEMYKEAMRSDTHLKKVILNQQKLIDDRILAKQIKKQKEELKKKQQQAQKKTQQALDQQKKENKQDKKDQKKDKQQQQKQNKQQNKQQQQKNQQNQNKQEKDKNNKDQKQKNQQDKNKQKDEKNNNKDKQNQQKQNEQNQRKKTQQKINDAKKAVDELKEEAEKRQRKDIKQNAEKAMDELKKAQKEHQQGNGEKSEEHIKKALEKLGKPQKQENKDKEKENQQNKDQKDKQNKDQQKNNRKLQKQKPQDQQAKPKEGDKKEKEIDPRQAAALLEMMANDEKNLRDALKEQQRKNARIRKVLKDW